MATTAAVSVVNVAVHARSGTLNMSRRDWTSPCWHNFQALGSRCGRTGRPDVTAPVRYWGDGRFAGVEMHTPLRSTVHAPGPHLPARSTPPSPRARRRLRLFATFVGAIVGRVTVASLSRHFPAQRAANAIAGNVTGPPASTYLTHLPHLLDKHYYAHHTAYCRSSRRHGSFAAADYRGRPL